MDLAFQQPFDASMGGPITASSGSTTCGTITVREEETDNGTGDEPSDTSPVPEVPTGAIAGGVALVILLVVFLLMD